MRYRFSALIALRLIAGAVSALAAASAFAQAAKAPPASQETPEWSQPRTPWGDPDLQGTWTSDNCIRTPMSRPVEFGDRLYMTAEEIAQREQAIAAQQVTDARETAEGQAVRTGPPPHWGERARKPCGQTSLVVDPPNGRVPDLLPEAKTRVIPQNAGIENPRADTWEDFQHYIRCITRGVTGSIFPVIYGNGQEFVQGPGYVMILQEMVHEARVIPLDGRPHAGPRVRSYMGDARGHWEGDTLVVETTNFRGGATGTGNNGGGTPTSDALKLVERYTRTGPADMRYEVTIDDPKTYVRPYKVSFPLTQEPGYQNFEYACHEGNYGMYDSLSGARAKEREAKEKAEKAAAAEAAVQAK
jgi:hypothetical protein